MRGHGQSKATRRKLFILDGIIRGRFAKLANLSWLQTLWAVDLNAGCGWNDRTGELSPIPGTPLIVASALRDLNIVARHVLVDIDPAACASLRTLPELDTSTIIKSDNAKWLSTFDPGPNAGGIMLCDPNGPADLPYEELHAFASRQRYFDYIVNHNLTAAQRSRGVAIGQTKFAAGNVRYVPLADKRTAVQQFGKAHHLIARENVVKSTVWFIFVATNDHTLKGMPKFGLYDVNSPQGKSLIGDFNGAQLELKI